LPDKRLDTRGLRCPLPVLRLESALRTVPFGATIEIVADDPIATLDIPNAARDGGHAWRRTDDGTGKVCVFEVTRAR
jgi:tRNA 2-thiouridine synthesizing protein A